MLEKKVLVIGDSGVGKTAIIHGFITGSVIGGANQAQPTIGVANQIKKVKAPNGEDIKLDVWDTAGDLN